MMIQVPSVGRIIHLFRPGRTEPDPAMITRVHSDDCVNLMVLPDQGMPYPMTSVLWGDTGEGTRWVWPPQVHTAKDSIPSPKPVPPSENEGFPTVSLDDEKNSDQGENNA